MPDEDTSDSPFEVVAKSADPTLNEKGEQIGGQDEDDSGALGWEMDRNQKHGLMNPSKVARTYQAKRKMKQTADPYNTRQKAATWDPQGCCQTQGMSLLDSPPDSKEIEPPSSPQINSRLAELRQQILVGDTPRTLDEYMSRLFSLQGILRMSLFLIVFGGIYKVLGSTVPTKQSFKIYKRRHYEESSQSFPSLESWFFNIDISYYKPNIERIKYKDYGLLALARTVQKPGHYFVGILGKWYPMPYLAPRSDAWESGSAKTSKKSRKKHAWGVCMVGRCFCAPQVDPYFDLDKCEDAVWDDSLTRAALYGGFVAGIVIWSLDLFEFFCVTFGSFVNPFNWYSFFTAPFMLKSYVDMVSTIVFTLTVQGAVQSQNISNFRLWAIFFAGSYAYALGSFIMTWFLNDWTALCRFEISGVFGGLAAWLGFLSVVSEKPIFTWQLAALFASPLNVRSKDLFFVISILDIFDSRCLARFAGLGMAFYAGAALHTFFFHPFS